ncbi:MATE family efflux transporter [Neopusillimonas aromaticivorans]|uniref:MATE family efflux transporter n=1 Tax=Neopusillimonas aromaticivorans TaxID=2979868 RepID=UPI0025915A55|nr:MATE family efflux transporter [Neopusillimonas aromaticivorans]WJJ93144.1 MATE family efflux transporter [Neopusillimonas aromaticivorans]
MNAPTALPPTLKRYLKETVRQAWPVLISAWASMAFAVIDTTMAGHTSAADLQAMSLAVSIYLTIFIGLMGVIHALIPIIGQHFGAGRLEAVGQAWGQGVWLALGLSAAGAITLLFPEAWLEFSGNINPEVMTKIRYYLYALILAMPAALIFRTIYCLGTAVSRPKVVMTINLVSIPVKALLNWAFMFGKFGLPAMGAAGAGLSTAAVSWLMLAMGLWVLRNDGFFRQFRLRPGRPRWSAQKELLRLGLPMGGSYLVEVCAFTFMALMVAREGMFVSGSHQIMANLAALCYMMPMAIGIASASLTSQAIGARDPARAMLTGRAGFVLALSGALLTSALLVSFKPLILALYTTDPDVTRLATQLLFILPIFHLFDAMQCINTYVLRAWKVAVMPLVMQVVALTGIGLIGGWYLGFGPAAGALQPIINAIMPNAPTGAATLWLTAALGLGLSALLLRLWYWRTLKRYVQH